MTEAKDSAGGERAHIVWGQRQGGSGSVSKTSTIESRRSSSSKGIHSVMAGILAQGAPTYRCAPTQTAANHVAAHVIAGLRMPNFGETAPSRHFDSKGQ